MCLHFLLNSIIKVLKGINLSSDKVKMESHQRTKFRETEIGMIPEDWKIDIFSKVVQVNPRRELKKGSNAKKVSMQNVLGGQRKIDGFEMSEYRGGSKFQNKDTLMARIAPCLENGKIALVDILGGGEIAFGSTEFNVLSGRDSISDDMYVYYLSKSPFVLPEVINSMVGTSGRQRVQNDVFDNILIPFPEIEEQSAIAKVLSDLDAKIELNQQMNKTLESIGQALFKRWFINFEFPDENGKPYKSSGGEMVDSELGEIPKGWRVKPIDEVAEFLNGLALQKFPAESKDEFLPVVKIRELKQGITESSDRASKNIPSMYVVNDGDVLFSWSGSLEVVIWSYGKGALNQHLFKVTSKEYPKWFYYYWVLQHLPEYRHIAEGKATTMGHIQRHHLKSSLVLVPDKDVLSIMDGILSPVINKQIETNVEVRNLSNIRDSLLPRLMSGRIRVG